jgi:serine/threonine protein kinase
VDVAIPDFHPVPFGQYLLLERIGTGGMAEIFRAKTFGAYGFEKEYAIKRILPNLGADGEFVSMFVNEAKLVVDLYHANIVQVFDLGEIEGAYFIAMEFVQGKDLLDLLARCAENDLKIPLKLSLYITMEMLKGLDFAHKASDRFGDPLNIIHRDVSPSNVMLSYGGDVKIGDFGVAKAKTQTQMTEAGTLKGKVGYMSPEQVRGDEIDQRSDVFAAGIILYEVLTMTRLFMGGSDLDVMLKIRDSDIEDELSRCRKVPPTLVRILRTSLAKGPEDRYQTAEDLYDAIRDFAYTHNIKTSNQDLASFLRRIFSDEIEKEQSRRLKDPTMSEADVSSSEQVIAVAAGQVVRGSDEGLDLPSAQDITATDRPSTLQTLLPDADASARVRDDSYRYRNKDGDISHAMSLKQLQTKLAATTEDHREAVSVDDGDWISPDDVPQLWGIERPTSGKLQASGGFRASEFKTDEITAPRQEPGGGGDDGLSLETKPWISRVSVLETDADPTHEGNLGRTTLARLLFRLDRRRHRGMLSITGKKHRKEIFFRRGDVVMVTSTRREELLGTYLVKRGIISEDQLNQALERLSEFGGRLGDALVGERLLPTYDLFRYLGDQLRDRILDLFTWRTGEWAWTPEVAAPHEAASLGVDMIELILDAIRNHIPPLVIRQHFTGREHAHLEIVHSRVSIDVLPLHDAEIEVARAVKPGTRPTDLVEFLGARRGAAAQLVWRMLYVLTEFELYRLGDAVEEPLLPG